MMRIDDHIHYADTDPGLLALMDEFNLKFLNICREKVLRGVDEDFAARAIACKVWKNVGMEVRRPDGQFFMVTAARQTRLCLQSDESSHEGIVTLSPRRVPSPATCHSPAEGDASQTQHDHAHLVCRQDLNVDANRRHIFFAPNWRAG